MARAQSLSKQYSFGLGVLAVHIWMLGENLLGASSEGRMGNVPGGQTEFRKWCVYFEPNCVLFGKFGGWGWEEFSRRGLGFWFKISADVTANRGLSRRGCVEMPGIPARGFCEASVRVMSCRAGTICVCL